MPDVHFEEILADLTDPEPDAKGSSEETSQDRTRDVQLFRQLRKRIEARDERLRAE